MLEVGEERGEISERIVGLVGAVSELSKRVDNLNLSLNKRMDDIRNGLGHSRAEIRELRNRIWWVVGLIIVSIIVPVILKFAP